MENSNVKKAVEVLVNNGMRKTGYFKAFTGYEDLRIDEIEILEFLLQFDGAFEKFIELTEANKGEYANTPIWKLDLYLNKIHNFGYHNLNKVDVLDNIKDISEIDLKPRHTVFLNIIRELKPDIDKLFVEAYNQTHSHLNPFRVEQVLFYLREELEYEGIKVSYSDFCKAVPHTFTGNWKPYFCKSNFAHIIVDTNGMYSGQIFLMNKDIDKSQPLQWWYTASISPDSWYGNKELADITVEKLRELRDISGLSKDLDWEVVYANHNDLREKDLLKELNYNERLAAKKHEIIEVDIPKDCIGKMRQAAKEINKKFTPIINEINKAWRTKKECIATC